MFPGAASSTRRRTTRLKFFIALAFTCGLAPVDIAWAEPPGAGVVSNDPCAVVAIPGGPYSGLAGVPLSFDGTRSSDPDGRALTYSWDFGTPNGSEEHALGSTPVHTYDRPGRYAVALTVTTSDALGPSCSNSATATVEIGAVCPAVVINRSDAIRLNSERASWSVSVQPAIRCYENTDVDLSTFVLRYAGREIPASSVKPVAGDENGDGIAELRASFAGRDLKALFSGARHVDGRQPVSVEVEARLATGGVLRGTTQVNLLRQASGTAATVSPNPFNPRTTLTFTTTRSGSAKVAMFDVAGRLVRSVLDEPSMAPGMHAIRIEGRGDGGESLASGIYFIRGVTADGAFARTVALLK